MGKLGFTFKKKILLSKNLLSKKLKDNMHRKFTFKKGIWGFGVLTLIKKVQIFWDIPIFHNFDFTFKFQFYFQKLTIKKEFEVL